MKRTILTAMLITLFYPLCISQDYQTIQLSDNFTTHLKFANDITSVDLGSNKIVASIAPAQENVLRIKASSKFEGKTNITIITKDGNIQTLLVEFHASPLKLLHHFETNTVSSFTMSKPQSNSNSNSNSNSILSQINSSENRLSHLGDISNKIHLQCVNLYTHADSLYISLSLKNRSNLDYACSSVKFIVKMLTRTSRGATSFVEIYPTANNGTLNVPAKSEQKMTFSFKKLTLKDTERLGIYIYEEDGNRDLSFNIQHKEVNNVKVF